MRSARKRITVATAPSTFKAQLIELREQCKGEGTVDACGIVHGLASMETQPALPKRTHVG